MSLSALNSRTSLVSLTMIVSLIILIVAIISGSFCKTHKETFESGIVQFESKRFYLISHGIRNLFFYNILKTQNNLLYNSMNDLFTNELIKKEFQIKITTFDIVCQKTAIEDSQLNNDVKNVCKILYPSQFAELDRSIIPTFINNIDSTIDTLVNPNSYILINNNEYQILYKNISLKKFNVKYDSNNNIVALTFLTPQPYLSLLRPYIVELPRIGFFQVIYDVQPDINIMNSLQGEEKTLFLQRLPSSPNGNADDIVMNYEGTSSQDLTNIPSFLSTFESLQYMKILYIDFKKYGVLPSEYSNIMTIYIDKDMMSKNFSPMRINSGKPLPFVVQSIGISASNNIMSLTIDEVDYNGELEDMQKLTTSEEVTDYHIIINFAFNVVTVYMFYIADNDTKVFIKRIPIYDNEGLPDTKVFFHYKNKADQINYYVNFVPSVLDKVTFVMPNLNKEANSLNMQFLYTNMEKNYYSSS